MVLPKGYEEHPNAHYPVIYEQNHFNLRPPLRFSTEENPPVNPEMRARLADLNIESGHEFFEAWTSDNFPRMIAVSFQHPTPYYDDSYAVNSVNNGPYGDALVKEMIPYLEAHFRMIPEAVRAGVDGRLDGRMGIAGGAGVLSGFFRRDLDALSRLD